MVEPISPAALLVKLPQAALSHESAARVQGIELLDDGTCRATVPRSSSRVAVRGWRICRADLAGHDVVQAADGARLTAPLRTVLDLVRVLPLREAVIATDSALRRQLVSSGQLVPALLATRGPGSAQGRRVASLLDPLSGSVLETALRVLLVLSGTEAPRTQFWVADGSDLFARVDFCWPRQRLIVEADGFAFHSDREAYRRDRARMNRLERLGWRVLRFTWEDVMAREDHVVAMVHSCLSQSAA